MAFTAPTDLAALDSEALAASVEEAIAAFAPLGKLSDEEVTDEQLAEMETISGYISAAKNEGATREAAAAERSQKIASIREAMNTKPDAGEEEAPAAEEEAPAEVIAEAPVVEEVIDEAPAVDEAPIPSEAVDEEIIDKEEATVSQTPALVAGGSLAGRAARNAPKADEVSVGAERGSIVASADVPNVTAGQKFDSLKDASVVLANRLAGYNGRSDRGNYTRNTGLILTPKANGFNQNDYKGNDLEMLLAAGAESRLQGQSLIAAGGWGAPSERSLDFCSIETTDGLLDLPEVTVTRGGLEFTKGPDFASVLASATGFWDMTEAVAEAGTELKTALRPAVPTFTDVRLDAVGFMLEAGLLMRNAWPELIQRYAEMALVAHAHKVSAKSLKQLKAIIGAAIEAPNGVGNAIDILHVVEVVAAGERQRYAMGLNDTLEAIIPLWLKPAIRADLANRTGVDMLTVTDAQIDAFFAARKVRVQWIYTEQKLDVTTAGVALSYPDKVEVSMYPAGTFVRGVTEVISLDTVYDSVNLKKNDFVHLFVEQGTAVVNPCFTGRTIKIPLFINGRTAAADLKANFGKPTTP